MANEWIVEFTDEFELWWLELSELVQEKCAAVVDLMHCGNCVSNVAGIRIGSSTHLIRNEMLC